MQPKDISTDFLFWGRDHVHGTHVFEDTLKAIVEWGGESTEKLALAFMQEIDRQGRFILFPTKELFLESKESLNAEIRGTVDGDAFFAGLICDGEPVEKTIPDDESALVETASLDEGNKVISMAFPGRERIFTRVVAMNKLLLNTLIAPEGYTPWRLGRLAVDLPETTWEEGTLSVKLLNNVGNMMTRSKILLNDKAIGEIQFARRRM